MCAEVAMSSHATSVRATLVISIKKALHKLAATTVCTLTHLATGYCVLPQLLCNMYYMNL